MTFAEGNAQSVYGKSADPKHADNQNHNWQSGYQLGARLDVDKSPSDIIRNTWIGWQENGLSIEAWKEWKRGLWAGFWSQRDKETAGRSGA